VTKQLICTDLPACWRTRALRPPR